MLDRNPTAAQLRVMRADATRTRAQHAHDVRHVVVDDAARDVHDPDCRYCSELLAARMAVAS